MRTALGVECRKDRVLLAVARDGALVDGYAERLDTPSMMEQAERLQGILDAAMRVLAEVRPDVIRILMPEQTYSASYARIAPRVAVETLICLAAYKTSVRVERLARATARSRLGMPRTGRFQDHIAVAVGAPVGKYWNDGRSFAAAAALAED